MSETRTYPNFEGVVGRTREESTPWWAPVKRATPGSPNIVILYMDDMGYSDIGCFGSEIATPHIDAVAARGLSFNHYTTHPICSSARAALLTGRNAHAVSTGWLSNNNPGYPGYTGDLPFDAPTLAETLRAGGYATVCVGKWHNSTNTATPNDTWPTGRGFERFYGFVEGEVSYFYPALLLQNNMPVPIDSYPPDYYATDDFTDQAIGYLKDIRHHAPRQPFFLYLAPNAMHGPLQAKESDMAKYRGHYDVGWDEIRRRRLEKQKALGLVPPETQLAPRDRRVPAWDTLPADQRALFARHMETYAGMLDCIDQNVGRLIAHLQDIGELDNTIFLISSDNGGTSAGDVQGAIHFNRRFAGLPPHTVEHNVERKDWIGSGRSNPVYPLGWGQTSNTPFPAYKTQTGGGGRRVSFVVSWPKAITNQGRICEQFAHVTDVMPTLLDLAGVAPLTVSHGQPAQPMDGKSLKAVLLQDAPSPRGAQYYECWANRAYYRDGWVAVSLQIMGDKIDFDNWTLHRHDTDFSESTNLAAQYPEKLAELVKAFDEEAWANMVYPLDNRTPAQKFHEMTMRLSPPKDSRRRFFPGGNTIHRTTIVPLIADRDFRITVNVDHAEKDEGVLFALGDVSGGIVMYIENGELHLFYNGFGDFSRLSPLRMPPGKHAVALQIEALGQRQGRGRLLLDGEPVDDFKPLSPTMLGGFHEGLDIGIDRRAPVEWDLFERRGAFQYTGTIHDLIVESGAFAADTPLAKASVPAEQRKPDNT